MDFFLICYVIEVKKAITDFAIHLATNNLPGFVNNLASNAIKKFERKISRKGAVRVGKGFTSCISNKDTNDIIKIIISLADANVFIVGVSERVEHEINKTRKQFPFALLAPLAASLVHQWFLQ